MSQTSVDNAKLEAHCRRIYDLTRDFEPIASLCRNDGMGFEILLGPPIPNARIAFIGYQPGDGHGDVSVEESRALGYESWWVTQECQYAEAYWPLARRLRGIFDKQILRQCVGINAIFVRAKTVDEYTRKVSLNDRRTIQSFCREQVQDILSAIKPINVVVIGHGTLDLFGGGRAVLTNAAGQTLVKRGLVCGQEAHSIMHLTGARIRSEDRRAIARFLREATGVVYPDER